MDAATLVGRDEEFQRARRAVRSTGTVGPLLTGPPGVGKTRLARALIADAADAGRPTATVTATRATAAIPYGAFAALLPAGDLAPGAGPLDVLLATAGALRERPGLVLAVDDAHLLDAPSAALLHHVADTDACRLVVTTRPDVTAPDAVTALWRDELLDRIDVGPLTPVAARGAAEQLLEGPVEAATARVLHRRTGGNPLLLREVVVAARTRGTLRVDRGRWRLTGPIDPGPRLTELVATRIAELDDDVRHAVEIVAFGEPLEAAALEAVCGADAGLAAERTGLVVVARDGRRTQVRLAHPVYGDAVRLGAPTLRAREILRRLLDVLDDLGGRRREDLLRRARWALEAGGTPPAGLLTAAARRALAYGDAALGLRLADAASVADEPEGPLLAAEATVALGRVEDARIRLEALKDRAAGQVGGEAALLRATVLGAGVGRFDEATAVLETAAAGRPADDALGAELEAARAMLELQQGRIDVARRRAEGVLGATASPPRARLRALLVVIPAWAHAGRTTEAVATARGALELLAATPDAPATAAELVRVGLCLALGLAGDYDEAERLADRRHLAALEHVADELRAGWMAALGHLALARGGLARAVEQLDDAARLVSSRPVGFGVASLAWCYGCLAEAHACAGRPDAAAHALELADAAVPAGAFIPNRELGRIWVLAAQGELDAAVGHALATAARARGAGAMVYAATALHDAARLGAAGRAVDELDELATLVDVAAPQIFARHAHALLEEDADGLLRVADDLERAGRVLLAAEAAAEAARSRRLAGDGPGANAAALRADALNRTCGATTPALVHGVAQRPLTPREHEIALRAAAGRTSREIAEDLVVSVRTVDNTLQRVYDKLGVRRRGDLADALAPIRTATPTTPTAPTAPR